MLMPDNFWENRVRLPIDTTVDNCDTNTYDSGQWTQLEALGVVFIPEVYYGWVNSSKKWEYYFDANVWLSTWRGGDNASIGSRINVYGCDKRNKRGIRLIKDVK